MMLEIDNKMKDEDVPIFARQIRGLGEVAKRLQCSIRGGPLNTGAIPGNYNGESLSAHINDWFERRYGDRLKHSLSPGSAVYILDGDPWLVELPRIFGKVRLICHTDITADVPNIFRSIKQITPETIARTSHRDRMELMQFFVSALNTFHILEELGTQHPLASSAIADLTLASQLCCSTNPQLGLSRWHSLQGAEKAIKLYLTLKDAVFPYTHNLTELLKLVDLDRFPTITDQLISIIQCPAKIRYGEIPTTLNETASAQMAAMHVASIFANELARN